MVRVEDITERKQKFKDETRQALDLAKKFFPTLISGIGSDIVLYCSFSPLEPSLSAPVAFISPDSRRLRLHDKRFFERAEEFAQQYEDLTGREVTIETDYSR